MALVPCVLLGQRGCVRLWFLRLPVQLVPFPSARGLVLLGVLTSRNSKQALCCPREHGPWGSCEVALLAALLRGWWSVTSTVSDDLE